MRWLIGALALLVSTNAHALPTQKINVTGNAATATALSSNPAACSANNWVNDIAADGTLSCAQPAFTNISGTAAATQGGTGTATVATGDILYGSASNVWSKLGAGTQNQNLTQGASSIPAWIYPLDMARMSILFEEFWSYTSTKVLTSSSSGATFAVFDATYSVPDGTSQSVIKATLSNTTHYSVWSPSSTVGTGTLSGGAWFFETRVLLSHLSDATDTQSFRAGAGDNLAQAEPVDGCFVYYTHSNNSGNLTCRCCNASSCTSADSATAMTAGAWWKFRVTSNSDGTSVQCSASVSGGAFSNVGAAITTNIPVAYPNLTAIPWAQFAKTVGTGSRFIIWDYIYSLKDVTR